MESKMQELVERGEKIIVELKDCLGLTKGIDFLSSLGDITKFKNLPDGWVRWELINRDFGPEPEKSMTWSEGKEYATGLKARLGTRLEHFLLFCAFKSNPEIKAKFFPKAREDWYFTEEDTSWSSGSAWCVTFSSGNVSTSSKGSHNYVRPCRASQ